MIQLEALQIETFVTEDTNARRFQVLNGGTFSEVLQLSLVIKKRASYRNYCENRAVLLLRIQRQIGGRQCSCPIISRNSIAKMQQRLVA